MNNNTVDNQSKRNPTGGDASVESLSAGEERLRVLGQQILALRQSGDNPEQLKKLCESRELLEDALVKEMDSREPEFLLECMKLLEAQVDRTDAQLARPDLTGPEQSRLQKERVETLLLWGKVSDDFELWKAKKHRPEQQRGVA